MAQAERGRRARALHFSGWPCPSLFSEWLIDCGNDNGFAPHIVRHCDSSAPLLDVRLPEMAGFPMVFLVFLLPGDAAGKRGVLYHKPSSMVLVARDSPRRNVGLRRVGCTGIDDVQWNPPPCARRR